MNTIAAIDTIYKGYRFRSRLEARWALFFDLCGMAWHYEAEPIKVNGEAYLPDFKLAVPELRQPVYLEVKPNAGGYFSWPRVYLMPANAQSKMSGAGTPRTAAMKTRRTATGHRRKPSSP